MLCADERTSAHVHDVVLVRCLQDIFAIRVDGEVVASVDGEVSMLTVYEALARIVLAMGGDPKRMRVRFAADEIVDGVTVQ